MEDFAINDYWMREGETDGEAGGEERSARVPDFSSVEQFASTFNVPPEKIARLNELLTAQPTRLLQTINANTVIPGVLSYLLYEQDGAQDLIDEFMARRDDPERSFSKCTRGTVAVSGPRRRGGS